MAWPTTNEGVPYYKPVEPSVPTPDNTAAKIISAGTSSAVSAFTQMALAAQRRRLEEQQMLQNADLAAKQLSFNEQKLAQDYTLTTRGQDIQKSNVDLDYDIQSRNLDLTSDLNEWKKDNYESLIDSRQSAMMRTVTSAKRRAEMIDEAGKDAEGLGLMDEKFQADHPMIYAANAYGYKEMYEGSTDKFLKGAVKHYIDKAEASKVTLKNPSTGKMKEFPWAHVARDLIENGDNSIFMPALQAQGLFDVEEKTTLKSGKKVPVKYKVAPALQRIIDDSKKAEFGKPVGSKLKFGGNELVNSQVPDEPVAPTSRRRDRTSQVPGSSTRAGQLSSSAELPEPEKDLVEQEAEWVMAKNDQDPDGAEGRRAKFLERHPDREDLINQ